MLTWGSLEDSEREPLWRLEQTGSPRGQEGLGLSWKNEEDEKKRIFRVGEIGTGFCLLCSPAGAHVPSDMRKANSASINSSGLKHFLSATCIAGGEDERMDVEVTSLLWGVGGGRRDVRWRREEGPQWLYFCAVNEKPFLLKAPLRRCSSQQASRIAPSPCPWEGKRQHKGDKVGDGH